MSGTQPAPATTETKADIVNTYGRIVVSAVIVLAFMVTLVLVLTKAVQESTTSIGMLNTLGTLASAVVYYWIGSSAGSTAKDAKMAPPAPAGSTTVVSTPATQTVTTAQPASTTTTTTGAPAPVANGGTVGP